MRQFDTVDEIEVAAAETAEQLRALVGAAALRIAAGTQSEPEPFGVILQHDVDHAGDRGRAVDRRCRAGQDVDVIDHGQRDIGEIGDVAVAVERNRIVRERPSVEQRQREARSEAEQADRVRGGREAAGELRVLHAAVGDRQRAQRVVDVAKALVLDVLRGDRDHGRGDLDLRLWNQRARDDDLLERARIAFVRAIR